MCLLKMKYDQIINLTEKKEGFTAYFSHIIHSLPIGNQDGFLRWLTEFLRTHVFMMHVCFATEIVCSQKLDSTLPETLQTLCFHPDGSIVKRWLPGS